MNYSTIQHRFANKQAGKYGCIKSGNVRYEDENYFSYSTIFGQWVDVEKNVVVIFDGEATPSSHRHMLREWHFPDDVIVLPYNDGGSYYGYAGCSLLPWSGQFGLDERYVLIQHYLQRIMDQFLAIKNEKKKDLERVDFKPWEYVQTLCKLYKDTSVSKWLRLKRMSAEHRKLATLLHKGERDVPTITDALFGEGTFAKYDKYCERFRKADALKARTLKICHYLGIKSPYEKWGWWMKYDAHLTPKQVRELKPKQRLELKFKALAAAEDLRTRDEWRAKLAKNRQNAKNWIIGFKTESKSPKIVRNMFTGEEYRFDGSHLFGFHSCATQANFDIDAFFKATDKQAWIREFYTETELACKNRKAIQMLLAIGATTKPKERSYDPILFVIDERVTSVLNGEELELVQDFVRRQDEAERRRKAQERLEIIRAERRKREREEEERFLAQVKQEQIDACLARGIEGKRDLWRNHLQGLHDIDGKESEFYLGGNVLLRLNLKHTHVETSKNIRIPIEACKKFWPTIQRWHEKPTMFKSVQFDTKGNGKYTIRSYENDIMTAGCHKIAYAEMEQVMNLVNSL